MVTGVTPALADEFEPAPLALVAFARKVYSVPLVRPVMSQVRAEVDMQNAPSGVAVAV